MKMSDDRNALAQERYYNKRGRYWCVECEHWCADVTGHVCSSCRNKAEIEIDHLSELAEGEVQARRQELVDEYRGEMRKQCEG